MPDYCPNQRSFGLSPRELEVLRELSKGQSNKEIAVSLGISEKTVKNHLHSIYPKLNVYDRIQAALFAVKNQLFD